MYHFVENINNHIWMVSDNYDSEFYVTEAGMSFPGEMVTGALCRKEYVLHFVLDGSCVFNGRRVCAGMGFIMPPKYPNVIATDDLYKHAWIIFDGNKAEKNLLETLIPIKGETFNYREKGLESEINRLCDILKRREQGADFKVTSILYMILGKCAEQNERTYSISETYVITAMRFIEEKCMQKISPEDVANAVGISHKHLCRIFSKYGKGSIRQSINSMRMKRAALLIRSTNYSMKEIAELAGFDDQMYFSQVFKKYTGQRPSDIRDDNLLK